MRRADATPTGAGWWGDARGGNRSGGSAARPAARGECGGDCSPPDPPSIDVSSSKRSESGCGGASRVVAASGAAVVSSRLQASVSGIKGAWPAGSLLGGRDDSSEASPVSRRAVGSGASCVVKCADEDGLERGATTLDLAASAHLQSGVEVDLDGNEFRLNGCQHPGILSGGGACPGSYGKRRCVPAALRQRCCFY